MIQPAKPTTIVTFRLNNNLLTFLGDHTYRLDREQAKNPALDSILNQCVNLISAYLDEFYPQNNLVIRFDDIVRTQDSTDVPSEALITAESEDQTDICESRIDELRSLVCEFLERTLVGEDNLFTGKKPTTFTTTQNSFIEEHTSDFISKNKGRPISKPFVCEIPGITITATPIQGAFKSPVIQNVSTKDDKVFFAHSDGAKGSDMLVFLRRIGTSNKRISGPTKEFIAEKDSHTKTAAAAYASKIPLVKVITYEKTDEKGRVRNFIKDISQAELEELESFESDLAIQAELSI